MSYGALKIPKFLTVVTVLAAGPLSGCARMSPVFSHDGATISFKGEKFKYRAHGQARSVLQI